MFKNFLVLVSCMFLLTACQSTKDAKFDSKTATRGMSAEDLDKLNKARGTQEDLEDFVGDRVFYGYDSSSLDGNSIRVLKRQAIWMNNNPYVRVIMEGHCDERGTREYNLALGDRRANAAKNYLVSLGINADRVTVVSYGKERPARLEANEEAYAVNRRAVTVVQTAGNNY